MTARYLVPVLFLMVVGLVGICSRGSGAEVRAPSPSPATSVLVPVTLESLMRGSVREETVEGAELQTDHALELAPSSTATPEAFQWPTPVLTVEATPHVLEVVPALPAEGASKETGLGFDYLARCGVPCWGQRLSHAEVEALALHVTGDPVWSSWAAWCFSTPGGESGGYVRAVGGPNRNGTYDLGFGQSNTATLAGLGYDAGRVLVDVGYAMEALYATWLVQGYGAWFGCKGE